MWLDDVRELVGHHVVDLVQIRLDEAGVQHHARTVVRHAAPTLLQSADCENRARGRLGREKLKPYTKASVEHPARLDAVPPMQRPADAIGVVPPSAHHKAAAVPMHAASFGIDSKAVLSAEEEMRLARDITAGRGVGQEPLELTHSSENPSGTTLDFTSDRGEFGPMRCRYQDGRVGPNSNAERPPV